MMEGSESTPPLGTKKWNGKEEMNQDTTCRNGKEISLHVPIPINWQQLLGALCVGRLQDHWFSELMSTLGTGGRSGSLAYNYLSHHEARGNQIVWATGTSGRTMGGSNYRPLFHKFRNKTRRNEAEKLKIKDDFHKQWRSVHV